MTDEEIRIQAIELTIRMQEAQLVTLGHRTFPCQVDIIYNYIKNKKSMMPTSINKNTIVYNKGTDYE
ncbi:MAG: hypothetical protein HC836_22685 [Richelia sp. RM2_1_2]|nr:hypothetical protein [Richelia sp. RM2_1_2]